MYVEGSLNESGRGTVKRYEEEENVNLDEREVVLHRQVL